MWAYIKVKNLPECPEPTRAYRSRDYMELSWAEYQERRENPRYEYKHEHFRRIWTAENDKQMRKCIESGILVKDMPKYINAPYGTIAKHHKMMIQRIQMETERKNNEHKNKQA